MKLFVSPILRFLVIYLLMFFIYQCKPRSNNQELKLENAWIRVVPPSAQVTGAYITISNSDIDDRLLKVSCDVSEAVEIHSMNEKDGMMMMRKLEDGIPLKPNEVYTLKPGGNHIMLIGLKKELKIGDQILIEMEFAKQGKKSIPFEVKDASVHKH